MEQKKCSRCYKLLPFSDFTFDKRRKIYKEICKDCFAYRMRIWRKNNHEKCAEYENSRREENKFKKRIYYLNPEYREKVKIRSRAYKGIKFNQDSKCNECGEKNNLQRHHPDYNKPLDIVILCKKCHSSLHYMI